MIVTSDYEFAALLATGQTTDYSVAGRTSKDDGNLQRGIAQSKANAQYVVLTTGQYSGTTAITLNANTDTHSNECVFDKATRLMWSRTQSASVFFDAASDLFWEDAVNGEDIFGFCDGANTGALSGFTDWRVPNIDELLTLIIYEGSGVPNTIAFPVWNASEDWCSTTTPNDSNEALQLSWGPGTTRDRDKDDDRRLAHVTLVRLGIESP